MKLEEFAQLAIVIKTLFKSNESDSGQNSDRATFKAQMEFPAWQDIGLVDAMRALMVLKLEGVVWEPTPGQVREVIAATTEDAEDYTVGVRRLREAVAVWRDAKLNGSSLATEFVENDDGTVTVVRDDSPPRWKAVAGPVVLEWLEDRGGISIAAAHIDEPTYQSQFRDWWRSRRQREVRAAAVEASHEALATLATLARHMPGGLLDQLPAALSRGGHDD